MRLWGFMRWVALLYSNNTQNNVIIKVFWGNLTYIRVHMKTKYFDACVYTGDLTMEKTYEWKRKEFEKKGSSCIMWTFEYLCVKCVWKRGKFFQIKISNNIKRLQFEWKSHNLIKNSYFIVVWKCSCYVFWLTRKTIGNKFSIIITEKQQSHELYVCMNKHEIFTYTNICHFIILCS